MRMNRVAQAVGLALGICAWIPATAQKSILVASNYEAIQVPSRVIEHVDDTKLVKLTGNTDPMARPRYDRGLVDPGKQLARMMLVLKRSPEQEKALAAFDERLTDPKSPDYHHWLHAEEFGRAYGPSDADIAAVTNWLQSHGFAIDEVAKGRIWIQFTGTVAQVQETFHLEMHKYLAEGKEHIANDRDPQIPEALSPVVGGVASLNDFFGHSLGWRGKYVRRNAKTGQITELKPQPLQVNDPSDPTITDNPLYLKEEGIKLNGARDSGFPFKTAQPELTYTDSNNLIHEDLAPGDFGAVYNITPTWNAGITGKGVTVAITATSDVTLSDIATYRSTFNLPATTVNVIQVDPANDPGITDPGENTEDLEMVSAAAPGATLDLVVSGGTSTTPGFDLADAYIVDNEIAPIMTVSYGRCELAMGTASNTSNNNIAQQGATEGITIFFAAGDSGSATCESQNTAAPAGDVYGTQVSGYTSSPYVTSVGGTEFTWSYTPNVPISTYWNASNNANLATAKGYIPEIPWNDTCANPLLLNIFVNTDGTQEFTNNEQLCNAVLNSSDYVGLVHFSAGGGGYSHCTTNSTQPTDTTYDPTSCSGGYAKPSWQTGTGVPADGHRDVPDIAMFASYGYGNDYPSGVEIDVSTILVCLSNPGNGISCNSADYTNPSEIIFQENGGTSAASPFSAGVMALILQKTGQVQGLANPMFYKLAATETLSACNSTTVKNGNACIFYDVTQGSNSQVCITGDTNCVTNTSGDEAGLLDGYSAGVGYDEASGLGSMNVTNLVNAWAAATGSPTITLTPTSLTFASTTVGATSASQSVTVKNTGTASASITNIEITGTNFTSFNGASNGTNGCTSTLSAGASCVITVSFTPTAAGTLTATLDVVDNAGTGTQTVALTGTGAAATSLTISVSPTTLSFASTTVGSTTAAQVVTVKNTGTAAATLTSETLTGTGASSFLISANTCTTSLAAGASCAVSVEFKPASAAAFSASLSVADNATGSPQTVALSGTGTPPVTGGTLSVTPASLSFASTAVGSVTSPLQVIVKNTGTTTVTFTGFTYTGANTSSFVESGINCGTTLAAGATCAVAIEFKPQSAGALTATLNIADNATGSPQTVALSGTGTGTGGGGTLSVTPASLAFASTNVGSVTAAQQVIVKNTGTTTVTFTGFTYTGANTSSFVQSGINCGTTLAAGASCAVAIEFKPAAAGALTASLSIADNATGSPQTVSLSGTGTTTTGGGTLTITPASLSLTYASTAVGSVTAPQQVIVKNTGTTTVTFTGFTYTGANTTSFVQSGINCGTTLAAGAACAVAIEFKPQSSGTLTATLNIADNATGSPQKVTLSGTGTGGTAATVTLSPTSLAFPNTIVGSTSDAQIVTLTNTGSVSVTVSSITLAGASPSSYLDLSNCGATLAASASCSIYVAFKPASAAALAATLSVADTATGSPQTVALTGTGTAAPSVKLSATSLAFGTVAHGTTSAAQMLTLTNSGTATLTLSSITLTGTGAADFEALDTCAATLAPSASCTVYVAFKPAAAAAYTATLSIADNGSASPQSVALSGTGD